MDKIRESTPEESAGEAGKPAGEAGKPVEEAGKPVEEIEAKDDSADTESEEKNPAPAAIE